MTSNSLVCINCRAQITAMHQNENATRARHVNRDGEERVHIVRKKVTGQTPTAYYAKTKATYSKLPSQHYVFHYTEHWSHISFIVFSGELQKY